MSQLDTVPTDFAPAIGIAPAEGLESEEGGRIVLEGLPNTRDVGGLPTDDGRYVKHARLLRSGALDHATARDLEVLLDDYQVRTVIDLRTEEERKEHPDPQDGLVGVRFADAPVYERMMLDEQSQRGFAQFFDDVLAAEDGSVLWHCTIGKDRAGLAAALLLHALGVKREAVEQDYLATNKYVQSETQNIMDALSSFGLGDKLDKSIHVINSADPRFLHAALDAVEKQYGSLDAYVRDQLSVTDEKREALRARYLTDDPRG